MRPEEIRAVQPAKSSTDYHGTAMSNVADAMLFVGAMVREIAAQLAEYNERERAKEERARSHKKEAGVQAARGTTRRTSSGRYYYVEHWKLRVGDTELHMAGFTPNDGQKDYPDLEVGEVTTGTLGNQADAVITRKQ